MSYDAKPRLGPTPTKRVLKRYRMLRGYLRQSAFKGVMLSRAEVVEIVEMLKPFYDQENDRA